MLLRADDMALSLFPEVDEHSRDQDGEHGLAVGDELIATENLRRFFEQHFHDLNDS